MFPYLEIINCYFGLVGTFGGNARGANCVFPFKYKGKMYNKCTKVNHNKLWCSTTADYDKDKKWGNCKVSGKVSTFIYLSSTIRQILCLAMYSVMANVKGK